MAQETREFAESVAKAIAYYCPANPIVANVGADNGFEAGVIEELVPGAIVYRFEPCGGADDTRPRWNNLVIGATDGPVTFYRMGDTALSSTYNRGGSTPEQREQVRLDTWARNNGLGRIDALFIDTEGSTLDVLAGAGDLLASVTFICAEVQTSKLYGDNALVSEVEEYLGRFNLVRVPGGYPGGQQENRFYARGPL